VVNDPVSTNLLRDGVAAALGGDALAVTEQSAGGEDFGWYLEHVPGAMCRLGVWPGEGPQPDLHQPNFDLDERALPLGVRVMVHVALTALASATPGRAGVEERGRWSHHELSADGDSSEQSV
jgi:amidohydrolase